MVAFGKWRPPDAFSPSGLEWGSFVFCDHGVSCCAVVWWGVSVVFLMDNFVCHRLRCGGGGVLVVCFWLGFGLFTALISSEVYFVESLILAQDERWRRA